MVAFNQAWGLDIGTSSVKAVLLSYEGSVVKVLSFAVEHIERGEGVDRMDAVKEALSNVLSSQAIGDTPVVAALSAKELFTKTINMPIFDPKTINRMVELEAAQQIPGGLDNVSWDYHLSPSPLDDGSYDVALFAAKNEIVEEYLELFKFMKINLTALSLTSLATYNFVAYDQEFEEDETVVILDSGAENTGLVVYQGDTLWTRSLQVAGSKVTNAFMKKFDVDFEEAEQLKFQVNESKQAGKVFKVVEPILRDLSVEVKRSLGFYKNQNDGANFENIVISGNTFKMDAVGEYMAENLGYAIVALVELDKIVLGGLVDEDVFYDELQGMSCAIGLGLQGIGKSKTKVNLMPKEHQLQIVLDRKKYAGVVVLILVALTMLINYKIGSGIISNSEDLETRVVKATKGFGAASSDAMKVFKQILPMTKELQILDEVGRQRGLAFAVQSGVVKVVNDIVQDEKLWLSETSLDVSEKGDPIRQPVYLESVELESWENENSVYQIYSNKRKVIVKVRVPSNSGKSTISEKVRDGLKELRITDAIQNLVKNVKPGQKLFSKVSAEGDTRSSDSWVYRDAYHADEEGNSDPIEEQRSLSVNIFRFVCEVNLALDVPKADSKEEE